jgi:uncharacterized protein YgbK (DUF1537 family)
MTDRRAKIRDYRRQTGRRTAVLDDDPTGSQSVHDVAVLTVLEPEIYSPALEEQSTAFILTNTRSMTTPDAANLVYHAGRDLLQLRQSMGGTPLDIVSRSDSTLRGHFITEIQALNKARTEVVGSGYDAVIIAPAYFEAGRFTSNDVHKAMIGGTAVPVGETEFAHDMYFGYRASNLREFIAEKTHGGTPASQVRSIGLDDIRNGGADRVADILRPTHDLQYVVVNGESFDDFEVVVLGIQIAQEEGKQFLYRTGPSFVRALIGNEPIDTLTPDDIWGEARPCGHGLAVVGSHVGLTDRQITAARTLSGLAEIEISVPRLINEASRVGHVAETIELVRAALTEQDVLLYTSREQVTVTDDNDSLLIARAVSDFLSDIVHGALAAKPSWIIAKGGITSHDIAVRGLGIRQARVLGQLFPGMVSVLAPVDARATAVSMPYIIFAGNVGDDNALADVIELLRH